MVTHAALVSSFADFPARLAASAPAAPDRPAPPGEWGPNEVVRHLLAVERVVWQARLTSIRDEETPHWSWTEPGLEPGIETAPLDDLLARFETARAQTIALVDSFDEATWARSGVHATYGRLDVAGVLRIATDHDADHLRALTPPDAAG